MRQDLKGALMYIQEIAKGHRDEDLKKYPIKHLSTSICLVLEEMRKDLILLHNMYRELNPIITEECLNSQTRPGV